MLTFIHLLWANKDVAALILVAVLAILAAGYLRATWPMLIALPCLALSVGVIVGDVRGFREGANASKTVVQALESANVKLSDQISACELANQGFAASAAASAAKQKQAEAALVREHAAEVAALKRENDRLNGVLHANKNAAVWGATRVPDSVARVLAGSG